MTNSSQPAPPVSSKARLLILVIVVLLASGGLLLLQQGNPPENLRVLLASATRLEISGRVKNEVRAKKVEGATEIANLVVQFKPAPGTPELCKCNGNPKLTFFRGDQELAQVRWQHGNYLGWESGSEQGAFNLDPASSAGIRKWFASQDYSVD